eukprot:SAG31_NODE_22714_length_519_cov_1.280952_1_plen_53_part_10
MEPVASTAGCTSRLGDGAKGRSCTKFSPELASIIQYDKFSCRFRILRTTMEDI